MSRIQFIIAMTLVIGRSGNLRARVAMPMAVEAFLAFTNENGIAFGDSRYAWDEAAAETVARQYEIDHWEAA